MNDKKKLSGLKKRQAITLANKSMFLWVAGGSVVVAFALVASIFLFGQLLFNNKVLAEKSRTDKVLRQNVSTSTTLKENINVLLADKNLSAARAVATDSNLQVVLDALPAVNDATNFASSLQKVLLVGVDGIDALTIESLSTSGAAETGEAAGDAEPTKGAQEIIFSFTVVGDDKKIAETLTKLERSIRPINIISVSLQGTNAQLQTTVRAKTYYQDAVALKLRDKVVTE